MNTVPFDQLGPGQSGRLAYQVLGQNGPIFNPQNIRYLPPDSFEIPTNAMSTGASGLSAGLAGVGLISSILNLGISAYIASQVAKLHKKVDRIERKVDYIKYKADRIDTQVAENNLRHALRHVLQKAVSHVGVNLIALADLRGDFEKFCDSLPSSLLLNFGLKLSSDIRDQLRLTYDLIYGIRMLVAQTYNISVDGQPEHVITVNPDRDYFSSYGGGELVFHGRATIKLSNDPSKKMEWWNLDDYLPQRHQNLFPDQDQEAIERGLYNHCRGWLYQTDAGLLWRTKVELDAIVDGYENTFWPELKDAEPCGFNQIDVARDVPLLENA